MSSGIRLRMESGFGRCLGNDEEVGGEVEVVGDGAVDGVAAAGWFGDLEMSPTIEGFQAARSLGHRADDQQVQVAVLVLFAARSCRGG